MSDFNQLYQEIESGNILPDQIYNLDLDYPQFFAIEHYKNYQHDTIDVPQKLHIVFLDIEVFSNFTGEFLPENAISPISACTIYSNFTKTFYAYLLLVSKNANAINNSMLENLKEQYKKELLEEGYLKPDDEIELYLFINNEKDLLNSCWNKIKELDPVIYTGWNSSKYDIPYIYNRLKLLYDDNMSVVNNILSKFGIVKSRYGEIQIVGMNGLDQMVLYKPRSEQGNNYGSTQASYSLDYISEQELGINKVEYEGSLDKLFLEDPIKYFKYNIGDVALCARLNEKLGHIELHNMIRRDMKTSLSYSLRGSSAIFDTYVTYELACANKKVKWGVIDIFNNKITQQDINEFPQPINKKMKWTINSVDEAELRSKLFKFPGAYVKDINFKLITPKDGINIDLDASLPPYEKIYIRRNNLIYHISIGDYIFQENDETLTWNNKNETCWRKVLGKIEHDWDGDLVTIETETGKKATVTSNHSIFGIKSKCYNYDSPQLIDAGYLTKNDYVVGYKKFETNGILNSIKPELIGFWLSDGWVSYNKYFYIAKQDKELLEIFTPYIDNIRIKRHNSQKYKEEWIGNIIDPIKTELQLFYNHSTSKNFNHILNYNLDNRKRIWEGMLFADGHIHGIGNVYNPTVRLCKYREIEKDECFNIAHTIGWWPQNTKNGINNKVIRIDGSLRYGPHQVCQEIYRSHKGYGGILQSNNYGCNCRHGLDKIGPLLPYVYNSYSDYIGLEKIKSITKEHYIGKVYDISVEETERFFAGTGIGAHNTALYPLNRWI